MAFLALQDSLTSLETALERLTGDSAAAGLFRLGQLKGRALSFMEPRGPGRQYALAHPNEYRGNEVAGNFTYTGAQWHALLTRFPDSPFADDAAWALANLGQGGECEHSLACFLDVGIMPYARFLESFPTSTYADSAAAKANERLKTVLAALDPDSLRQWSFDLEPTLVDSVLARYEAVVPTLTMPYRGAGLRLTAQFRSRLAELQGKAGPPCRRYSLLSATAPARTLRVIRRTRRTRSKRSS